MPFWTANTPIGSSPDTISGLIGWYDLNSIASPTVWNDKSSFKNNLSSITGSISGSNFSNVVLRNIRPVSCGTVPSGATIFVVATITPNVAGSIGNLASLFSYYNPGVVNQNSNLTIGTINIDRTSYNLNVYGLNEVTDTTYLITDVSTPNIYTGICFNTLYTNSTGSIGYCFGYSNGGVASLNKTPITITTDRTFFNIQIGDSGTIPASDGYSHDLNANIYEVLFYNTILPESNISQVHSYLQARWNTPALANGGNFQY